VGKWWGYPNRRFWGHWFWGGRCLTLNLCWAIWLAMVVETRRTPSHSAALDLPGQTKRWHGYDGEDWGALLAMRGRCQLAASLVSVTVVWERSDIATSRPSSGRPWHRRHVAITCPCSSIIMVWMSRDAGGGSAWEGLDGQPQHPNSEVHRPRTPKQVR
jgi:hypothetical protein